LRTAEDFLHVLTSLLTAIARGEITPAEGAQIAERVDARQRASRRLARLMHRRAIQTSPVGARSDTVISEHRNPDEKTMTDDAAWPLAQHVCHTGYGDLPVSAVESARRDILDTFGCMLGGSGSPGIDQLFAVIARWGGRQESRVLLRGTRVPAPQAALLNASMGHALDFDDTLDTGGSIHPGVSVLGSVLAVCDSLGAVSGRDVLLAVALGLDISCRIALASTLDRGWHRTAAMGVFGATAAAGKLLGLTPEQMLAAFGIAYSHAAGNRQCILDGALTKRMQAGQAASAGVFSAVLAQTGFTGARNIFNGRFGFLELYQPNGYDASVLLRDLGAAFRGEALSYKPYPCGRPLHAAIDAALEARARLEIARPDDIASVTIETDPAGHSDQFARGLAKRRPTQVVEAQFAQPFLVATALVHGKVGIAEVDGLGDAAVLSLSDRIAGIVRDHRPRGSFGITVQRTDGRSVTVEAGDPIGSPGKPLTNVQIETKFRDCARHAVQPLSDASVDGLLAAIGRLETLSDARELMTPVVG
jgi:2-methylcitrate dehydratase PrpD